MVHEEREEEAERDALGERLSHEQLSFLARVRRRVPGATLRWHRRGPGMLLEVRERSRGGTERSVLIARFREDGAIDLDAPVTARRRARR